MTQRLIFLDTETTGFNYKEGHRIIEFGAVEVINRKFTHNNLHLYFNPEGFIIDDDAFAIHGISNEFLSQKKPFSEHIDEILNFISDSTLVVHNAAFDIPFLDYEIKKIVKDFSSLRDLVEIIDTLILARSKFPGQRNSLDALCVRYGVNNKHRTLHGALLDAKLLAEVYLLMTGGQTELLLDDNNDQSKIKKEKINKYKIEYSFALDDDSLKAHQEYLSLLQKKNSDVKMW